MKQEFSVDFIWESLGDFWRLFDDAGVLDQLWRGYLFTVNNLYYQLYQLDLSKCIHTIPHEWLSDWELFVFDEATEYVQEVPRYLDYPYAYSMPYGVKDVTLLAESPRETVVLPHNTMLTPENILMLPDGTERYLGDNIYYPEDVVVKDDYLIFPSGIRVDTLKWYPDHDFIVDVDSGVIHFKKQPYPYFWSNLAVRDLEVIYENFGCLLKYYKPDSYKYLREVQGLWYAYWNGSTISNIEIGVNILRDLPFVLEEGVVENASYTDTLLTIGGQDVPVTNSQAELVSVGSTLTYVDVLSGVITVGGYSLRIHTADAALLTVGDAVTDKKSAATLLTISGKEYAFDGANTVKPSIGDFVPQFMPLTTAVGVYDYINYPGWWKEYIGGYDENVESCLFDGNAFFDSSYFDIGTFDATYTERCLEAIFLQYFTFLVRINQEAWFSSKEELQVVLAFLFAIKPAYTHFLFQFYLEFKDDTFTHDPEFKFGPWTYVPTDIPCDHHIFDMDVIHPTFDDGGYFDFDCERDCLVISIFGSPHIFYDDDVLGYTFDDPAVPMFDYTPVGFDAGPFNDSFVLEVTRKIPSELIFSDRQDTLDTSAGFTPS